MAGRRSGFVGRGRQAQRRQTVWLGSADIASATILPAAAVALDQILTEANLESFGGIPSTIVRTRGELWVKSDQVSAVEEPFGGMAMTVVDTPAQVAGIAALSTPIVEEPSDTFFLHLFFQGGNTALAAGSADSPWHRYSFDSKAMRKVEDGQAIVVVIENAHGTHGLEYILKFRMLLKLS